jgi:hypothetical protein
MTATALPKRALLQAYAERPDCFTDCYSATLPGHFTLADFVSAFYCTRLFRLERLILRLTIRRASSDAQAAAVALGTATHFAAWTVEARSPDQLLMCDLAARTRSWFMIENATNQTRLFFGSAVVPPAHSPPGTGLGWGFTTLLGFHKLYSRALLASARRRLLRGL